MTDPHAPIERTEVVVAGAGPVGLMLAGELRLAGIDVTVVERLAEPTGESRASQLNSRTMELLDQRGLLDHLGPVPNERTGHFGGIALDVGDGPSPHAGHWKVPQSRTEAVLGAWATGQGARIRRGHEVVEVDAEGDHVEVLTTTPAGPVRFRAGYLVGCDGEGSTVRRLAGFEVTGEDATRELLRADVAGVEVPDRRFERRPGGLAIAARRPDGVTRVMLHERGRPVAPRPGPPRFDEVVEGWRRVVGEDLAGGRPLWVDAFDNACRLATRFRRGRVLLAGDAAHRQMPIGGQSLNLGLHDAVNLGWKLAGHLRGWAPEGLLDTYHDERHPVATRLQARVRAQELLLMGGPELDATRAVLAELVGIPSARRHLAAGASGLDVRYDVGPGDHPLLGARLRPRRLVTSAGLAVTTAELLRGGRGLLLDLSPGGTHARHAGVERWADRLPVVTARPAPGEDGRADDDHDVAAVVVRPDGHVVWTAPGTTDLGTTLHTWFGAPAAGPARTLAEAVHS